MVVFPGLALLTQRARGFAPVISPTWVFVAANGALSLVWLAVNANRGLGLRQPLQQPRSGVRRSARVAHPSPKYEGPN